MSKPKGPARSRQRESFWRRIVARQPASGLSIRDWCDLQGVSEPSFYAWRRELARRAAERIATAARLGSRRTARLTSASSVEPSSPQADVPAAARFVEVELLPA